MLSFECLPIDLPKKIWLSMLSFRGVDMKSLDFFDLPDFWEA